MNHEPTATLPVVSTSWDDGHVLDHKLAQMLDRYEVPGTFYVAPMNVEFDHRDRLDAVGVRQLAERHEIGAHTLRHIRLPQLSDEDARLDIRDGRHWLEDVIGDEITTFCYVGGCYEPRHAQMVREQGFRLARTVERFATTPGPAMGLPTTINAYQHLVDMPALMRLTGRDLRLSTKLFFNWDDLAIHLFDRVVEQGGVFHLWGHSWEVEARDDWYRLERVLDHIGRRDGVRYAANSALPVLERA